MSVSRVFRRLTALATLTIALTGAAAVATATPAHAALPPIGSVLCHRSPTTGLRCGVLTNVNILIAFPDGGTVLAFAYNACAQPGDRGAAVFQPSNGIPVGTVFGAIGTCRTAGIPLP